MRNRLVGVTVVLGLLALDASARFATISGIKFEDVDGNGARDAGEPPVAGATIVMEHLATSETFTAVTAADGTYASSSAIPDGIYRVRELPMPGWTQTFPGGAGTYEIDVDPLHPRLDIDFGNRRTCAIPPADMTGWWPFDETTGPTAGDLAGADDAGTHRFVPEIVTGMVGNALRFDGGSQYVEVPSSPEIDFDTGDLSIDAWIRTTANGVATFIDKRSSVPIGYTMFLVNGRLGFALADRSVAGATGCLTNNTASGCTNYIAPATSTLVNDGGWHHVAVTLDRDHPSGGVLYVDGTAVLNFDPTNRQLSIANAAPLWIGRHHANTFAGDSFFAGSVDEVELFDRALAPHEVAAIFNAGPSGKCRGNCGVPSLIQSNFGTRGDFEVVLPDGFGGLIHYRRDNDHLLLPWSSTTFIDIFAGRAGAASLIQGNFSTTGNFEVVARYGDRLVHYWRDNDVAFLPWSRTLAFASGVRGTPSMVQGGEGIRGDFDVVVPLATGGLAHYQRDNELSPYAWSGPTVFGVAAGPVDDVSLIRSSVGNLELVARIGGRLAHFFRASNVWNGPFFFASGVSGAPALVQGRFGTTGNFEVVAPLAAGGIGHWWRDNDAAGFPWFQSTVFGAADGNFHSTTMIASNYDDNLEVVGQQCGRLVHYWRSSLPGFAWSGPTTLTP